MKGKQLVAQIGLILLFPYIAMAANGSAQTGNYATGGLGHVNPANYYCVELGYSLKTVTGKNGGQHSICNFPNGTSCESWEFLQGKCGEEYSFCAQKGYGQITKSDGKNPISSEYAVCTSKPSPQRMKGGETPKNQEIGSVTELMGLQKTLSKRSLLETNTKTNDSEMEPQPVLLDTPEVQGTFPSSFDWRNYMGKDWMTPVKEQSNCGACWAFSAVGTVEAAYNISSGHADLDLDLSEEFLNSDCPSTNPGSCCGGHHDIALDVIRDDGIPDEDCMGYDVDYYSTGPCYCLPDNGSCSSTCSGYPVSCSNLVCTGLCADWPSRMVRIEAYHAVPNDIDQIKQALVDKGPLSVDMAINMNGSFYDAQNIYRCTNCWDLNSNSICNIADEDTNNDGICDQRDCGVNHSVIIAGYDDPGQFWIMKNSWGDGEADGGYRKVGFGECNIEQSVLSVDIAPGATVRAENFDVFIFEDVANMIHTSGNLAAGGNVNLSYFQLNNIAQNEVGLVAAHDLTLYGGGYIFGDVYYGGVGNIDPSTTIGGEIHPNTNVIGFAEEREEFIARSNHISSLTPNGTAEVSTCWLYLTGTDDDLNIFELPRPPLDGIPCGINIDVPAGSAVVINVPGIISVFGNLAININTLTPSDILWNFYEALTIGITHVEFPGTTLAPLSQFVPISCHIDGAIIANSLFSPNFSGEIDNARFAHWDKLCSGSTCNESCSDMVLNQDETDLDCGGQCGATCELGMACVDNNDCASNNCQEGFCAEELPPPSNCSETTAIDLGTRGVETIVTNDGCVMIRDAYPTWPISSIRLDTTTICDGTVPFTWTNTCSGGNGSDNFTGVWQQRFLEPVSKNCATVIDLQGSGGNIGLRWY